MKLNFHLHFGGQCEEAFKFYEKVLGGKIEGMFRYENAPPDAQNVPPDWRNKIGSQPISNSAPVATTRSALRVRAIRLGFASM